MPLTTNTLLYAYREDLFEQKIGPREKLGRLHREAKALNDPPRRDGVTIAMKCDLVCYEMNGVLNVIGDGWFDKTGIPPSTTPGIDAVEAYKRLAQVLRPRLHRTGQRREQDQFQPGHLRAGPAMGDALRLDGQSRQIEGGRQGQLDGDARGRQAGDDQRHLLHLALHRQGQGYAVPPARERAARGEPARRGGTGHAAAQPRTGIRHCRRSTAGIPRCRMPRGGETAAALPEFSEASEIINKRIVQAIVGQMETKAALDAAATEVRPCWRSAATTSRPSPCGCSCCPVLRDDRGAGLSARLGDLL